MNTLKGILTVGVLGFAAVAYGDTRILVDAEASESTEGEVLSYRTIERAVARATELARDESNKPISVCVKDGTYNLTREIVLTNGVTLASENGRARVTLVPAANCRAVAVTGGTLAGVTIQGRTYAERTTLVSDVDTIARGLGIYMVGNESLVTNCLVRGVVLEGAQKTGSGSLALYMKGDGYCRDSVFTGCEGAFSVVTTEGNAPRFWNCMVTENKVASSGQAVFWVQGGVRLLNCLVADNEGAASAIFFNVWTYTTMDNCTVAGNTSAGVSMGSTLGFTLNNCAIIGNSGGAFALSSDNQNAYKLYNCAYDADSLPTNFTVVESCLQIASDACVFADAASGDWHPAAGSPLINAGTRQGLESEGGKVKTDLDGRARINGVQDIGCYEFDRKWDVPVLQVGLDRLGTPQVVSQAGTSIKFRPQLLRHGKKIEAESATFSYVWNGEEKAFGADGTASETFATGQTYDLVLKAVYDGQTVSASLPKAFVCVDSETTGKTFWVGLSGSNESPYDTPEKAAHSPVDAAKVAIQKKDATVLVMDGVYRFDETIRLTNGVRMASVAGDPRCVVFSGGTQNRMFMIGVDWGVRFNGSGELSGVTVQDAQAKVTSDMQCRGVLIESGCISNCVIRNIGGPLTWQKASDGCALTLATNWGGPGAKAVDCVIEDNVSALYKGENVDGYAKNGAAVKIGWTGLMDRCIVRNNRADDNKWGEDERAHGAGVFIEHASAVCRNTLVANNVSIRALGGVCLKAGRIENCTIAENAGAGEVTTVYGGGLYVAGGTTVNTIVTGNFAGAQEVNIACADGVDVASAFVNCCLKGFSWGTDCLSEDAQLDANFRPGEKSPVVNRGRKLDWMTAETLDLAHNPRVQKRKADMGCYETPYESTGILIIIR